MHGFAIHRRLLMPSQSLSLNIKLVAAEIEFLPGFGQLPLFIQKRRQSVTQLDALAE